MCQKTKLGNNKKIIKTKEIKNGKITNDFKKIEHTVSNKIF